MKTNKLAFVLVLSATLLAGCNITNNANSSILPEGASSVDETVASKKFAAAVANLGNDGAFGIRLENLNVGFNAEVKSPTAERNGSATSTSVVMKGLKVGGSVTNASFYAGVQGLTSSTASDVKAQVEGKADLAYNFASDAGTIDSAAVSQSASYTGLSAAAYVADSTGYANLSDKNFVTMANLLGTAMGNTYYENGTKTTTPAFTLPVGKYSIKDIFTKTGTTLPILSPAIISKLGEYGTIAAAFLDQYKGYFDTYTYSNGNYALDLKLTKEKISAIVTEAVTPMISSGSNTETFQNILKTVLNYVTINAAEIAIVYNEKSLVSFATDINVAAACTYGDIYNLMNQGNSSIASLPADFASAKESLAFNFNCKLNFLSGKDVTITLPTDLDSYTEYQGAADVA